MQVGWLRNLLGPPGSSVHQYLHYAGILYPVDASAELALRLKCLLLVSVCFKQRSLRHATAMPASYLCTEHLFYIQNVEQSSGDVHNDDYITLYYTTDSCSLRGVVLFRVLHAR